jgi:hypothetical protein
VGWEALTNGDLLAAAEADGFELLITADKNIRYQQKLTERTIALIVLSTNDCHWFAPNLKRSSGRSRRRVQAATWKWHSGRLLFAGGHTIHWLAVSGQTSSSVLFSCLVSSGSGGADAGP